MEYDVRKKIDLIRYANNKAEGCYISDMGRSGCSIYDKDFDMILVKLGDVDNLISALKKYKELYGG